MNLGRKRYRKPASYLRFLSTSGVYENYQITKQGIIKIDITNNFSKKNNNQAYMNDPTYKQSNKGNHTHTRNNLHEHQENSIYLNDHYSLFSDPNEKFNQINSEDIIYNNCDNQTNYININPIYTDGPQNILTSQPNLAYEQINYANTPIIYTENSNITETNQVSQTATQINVQDQTGDTTNNNNLENINNDTKNYVETKQNFPYSQPVSTDNQSSIDNQPNSSIPPDINPSLDDQTLYDKIMSDNINLVLKECHLVKPDEVVVLYKIVPE